MNLDGTLLASVDFYHHCVRIYSMVDNTAAPVIVGTAETRGSAHGQLNFPILSCFVNRNGVDTLLISHRGSHCQWRIPACHCS